MQADKVDFTVRWDRADLAQLQALAQGMGGMSVAALIRWIVRGYLERYLGTMGLDFVIEEAEPQREGGDE